MKINTFFLCIIFLTIGFFIGKSAYKTPDMVKIPISPPETGHIEAELVADTTVIREEIPEIENNATESAVKTLYDTIKADSNIVGTKVKIDDLHIDIKVDKLKNTIYVDWIKYYETVRDRPKKAIIGEIILMIDEQKYLSIGGSIGFPKIVNIMIHAEIQQKEKGISFSVGLGYLFY